MLGGSQRRNSRAARGKLGQEKTQRESAKRKGKNEKQQAKGKGTESSNYGKNPPNQRRAAPRGSFSKADKARTEPKKGQAEGAKEQRRER